MQIFNISKYKRVFIFLIACILTILYLKSGWCSHQNLRTSSTSVSEARPTQEILSPSPTEGEEVFLLADDVTLTQMDKTGLLEMYWMYINTLQVLCRNQIRLGSLMDGGKEICLDGIYKPRRPCLVYSFGSNFKFDFELSVQRHFRCEIHTFDPSRPITNMETPSGIHFHLTGLWNSSKTNTDGWKMNTLNNIRKKLNHEKRVVDILKIDVENAEWVALPDMFLSGVLRYVKQMSIEIHFGGRRTPSNVTSAQKLKVLRSLYEHGFHIFMHEHNPFSIHRFIYPYDAITTANEISLINVNYVSP